jgi:dihydrofolate reductase
MSKVRAGIAVSLDGYVAGPNQSEEDPLGEGGEALHDWLFGLRAWREPHGMEGGEENASSAVVEEQDANVGAEIMGRNKFGPPGGGPWGGDPWNGWWGDEPPFHKPVFVLTHHEREPLELTGTTFHFVTGGIDEALDRATEAAGGKDVQIHGGGEAVQAALGAGRLDELNTHIAPVLLGRGYPLLSGSTGRLERTRVIESPSGVTHIRYRVLR